MRDLAPNDEPDIEIGVTPLPSEPHARSSEAVFVVAVSMLMVAVVLVVVFVLGPPLLDAIGALLVWLNSA